MDYITDYLRKEIKEHNLKSGEIIFEYDTNDNIKDLSAMVSLFFQKYQIKTESLNPAFYEITQNEAIESIKYGLSTKANYTVIDKEFNQSDKNRFAHMFFELFKQPKCYTLDGRLYQTALNINDFWETGGAILIDGQNIGILWTNDLYDRGK